MKDNLASFVKVSYKTVILNVYNKLYSFYIEVHLESEDTRITL